MRLDRLIKVGLLCGAVVLAGCEKTYQDLVDEELASGVRNDSIFFTIAFGDTSKDFFEKCWEQNKKGVLFHGPRNMNVMYKMDPPADSVSGISMLFYPDLGRQSTIRKMDVEFSFNGWALWNEHLFADKLITHLEPIVLDWYGGNPFFDVSEKDGRTIKAKIDGNREIQMWYEDNHFVKMTITDKSI